MSCLIERKRLRTTCRKQWTRCPPPRLHRLMYRVQAQCDLYTTPPETSGLEHGHPSCMDTSWKVRPDWGFLTDSGHFTRAQATPYCSWQLVGTVLKNTVGSIADQGLLKKQTVWFFFPPRSFFFIFRGRGGIKGKLPHLSPFYGSCLWWCGIFFVGTEFDGRNTMLMYYLM